MADSTGATQTMEGFIESERKRLAKERQNVLQQRAKLDEQIEAIDREVSAIEAYEMAKKGKRPSATSAGRGTGKRRSGIRSEVFIAVKKAQNGITRSDLLDAMGMKGDRSGEQSVSNALSALKKGGKLAQKDGKYIAV